MSEAHKALHLAASGTTDDESAAKIMEAIALVGTDPSRANQLAAAALSAINPDSSHGGQALNLLGLTDCILGRTTSGRERLLEATDILSRHGPERAECRAWRDYGSVLALALGEVHLGIPALERALELAEVLDDADEQGAILARLGSTLGRAGRSQDASKVLQRAVDLLVTGTDQAAYALALDNLGCELIVQRDYPRALAPLRLALELRDPEVDRLHAANGRGNLAIALAGVGEVDEALRLINSIAPLLDQSSDPLQWADYQLAWGIVSVLSQDPEVARTHLKEALAIARARDIRIVEADALVHLSLAEEQCGNLVEALRYEREVRLTERRWVNEQAAKSAKAMEDSVALAAKRAENRALATASEELERRVSERTAELHDQMRERGVAEKLARFWSDHDWLTRLPNRRNMQALLESHLQRVMDQGGQLGVLFVDLDGFKAINDGHGHLAGDRLLRLTARRLRQHAPPGAVVTRFGGDEFVVLLPDIPDSTEAAAAAQRLRSAMLMPLKLDGRVVALSCSIGVAIGPGDATLPDELLRRADRAMLEAKQGGRNQVRKLDTQSQDRLERRSRLRRELGNAIENDLLSAAFQPIWDARRGCLVGAEMLARWRDEELGWVSPTDFIPVAEESGQIGALGLWAVRKAVEGARALRAAGRWTEPGPDQSGTRISVNVSTVQLGDAQFLSRMTEAVRGAGGRPEWLMLELTESVQLAEDSVYQQRMRELRDAGFKLAIDDFGAGYSSFSYLNRTYFDRLKIDRTLVHCSSDVSDRSAVTGSIILMAHRLGLEVVAEGVENAQQVALLDDQDCDFLQGYFIARPMALSELVQWEGQEPL